MKYQTTKPIKLLDALREMYPGSSNTTLRNMLKHRRISVDGVAVVKGTHCLQSGQIVCADAVTKVTHDGVDIIYKDRDIIIVNKPAGMLSVPLDEGYCENLQDFLRDNFRTDHIYAVHRLDKKASGVMVFARGTQSVKPLNNMFKKHDLLRVYIAVVQGNVQNDEGTWESSLQEQKNRHVRAVHNNISEGKNAITHYSVFHRSKKFSFLKVALETGRKHQIRVHCKEAGHAIIGDKRYGDSSCDPISRMCLHASLLEFPHPRTGKKMSFSAPIPKAFSKLGLIPIMNLALKDRKCFGRGFKHITKMECTTRA